MAIAAQNLTEGILLLTRQDYHLLARAGHLDNYKKTELIEGRIVVSAKGRRHVLAKTRLAEYLRQACAGQNLHVQSEDPIVVDDYNEPEPDAAVLRGQSSDYLSTPPASAVMLIAEVAFSTEGRDTGEKWRAYGCAGIDEYWIVNLKENRLEVWTQPLSRTPQGGYGPHVFFSAGEAVPGFAPLVAGLSVTHALAPEARGDE